MLYKIGNMDVSFEKEEKGIRVKNLSGGYLNNTLFVNQTIEFLEPQFRKDFNALVKHYSRKAKNAVTPDDIERVSFSVIQYALVIYNGWRNGQGWFRNVSVKFHWWWDLNHPHTYDIIFECLKQFYPDTWMDKAASMIGVSRKKCEKIVKQREEFHSMW